MLEEKYISSERGNTFYWISKKEDSLTLVLLPGLTANHLLYEKQIEYFEDKYSIVVWDCPCHGKSRPYKNYSYMNVTSELKTILDKEGVKEAVFIGQSLGGMIAQFFIDRFPDMAKGFISIDSVPFGNYYSKSDMFWLNQLEWMCKMFGNKTLRKAMAKACAVTDYGQKKMLIMLSDYEKNELCHLMYIGEAAFIPENKEVNLPCPVILILGDRDNVGKVACYTKEWSRRTGYSLYVVKDASHNANEDQPQKTNTIIESFIKREC